MNPDPANKGWIGGLQVLAAGTLCAALGCFLCAPAVAFTPLGRLDPADIPPVGHWRFEADGWYTPYTATLDGVPEAKDCAPGATSANCVAGRPVISRHWAEMGLGGEVAVAKGLGLDFRVPLDLVVQFAHDPSQLPPGLAPSNFVVGDVSLGLDRVLLDLGGTHVKARLLGSAAPMGPPGGDPVYQCPVLDAQGKPETDASGNPILTTDTVFADSPTVKLELAAAQDLLDSLRLTVNATVHYPLIRTGPEPVETWNGISYSWGAGLSWWAWPQLGASLDLLGDWSNPAQQNGAVVCQTGHNIWDLSPGVAFKPEDGVTIGANVLFPVLASGFQWDYIDPLLGAVTVQFEL